MNNLNTMSQQPPPQQRPPYFHRPVSTPAGMSPPPFLPQHSPQLTAAYPPLHQYPHPQYPQPPAPKRARLSPGAQSPYMSPSTPQMPSNQAGSVNMVNGFPPGAAPPGSMGPPSRPADKPAEDRTFDDILAGTGINIEEEDRRLTTSDFYGHPTPNSSFQSHSASFGPYMNGSQERRDSSGNLDSPSGFGANNLHGLPNIDQVTPEEAQRRREVKADWDAGKHAQHPLWDPFLWGETLQRKIQQHCYDEHIKAPERGVLKPPKDMPPQVVRVDGLEGASRVIDKGQTILDIGNGDQLREMLNVVCLAAKERVMGLLDLSARLALERRHHSMGRVPTEWASMAAVSTSTPAADEGVESPAAATLLKRTHSQANADSFTPNELIAAPNPISEVFQKLLEEARVAEETRLAKRARRNASTNPDPVRSLSVSVGGPDTPGAVSQDSEKKVTKKDRKLAESKFTEQQQHKSANETARMATAGILGGKFGLGKGKKQYSWLSGGPPGGGSSPLQTPVKANTSSMSASAATTPGADRAAKAPKRKGVGQWDEDQDAGIQARDVFLVLETDGKAPRAYVRGLSKPEGG